MSILWWLVVGLIAGALAKLIMPGKDPGGCIVTILLGIAGAFVGGWLGQMLGLSAGGPTGIIGATIGAIILLLLYRLFIGRNRT